MARISLFSSYLLVTVLASVACAAPAHAGTTNEEAVGVIAPDDDANNNNAPANNGIVPNSIVPNVAAPTAAEPAVSAAPANGPEGGISTPPAPQYSTTPGQPGVITDLGMASAIYGGNKQLNTNLMDFSKATHAKVNGKLPVEFMVEAHIKRAMSDINNPAYTREQRNAKGHEDYEDLATMDNTLRQKQLVPDATFKSIGLTDEYLKEEKDGDAAALTKLDAALEDLKSYQ